MPKISTISQFNKISKVIHIVVWIVGTIALYTILQVKLGIAWTIGAINNADDVNEVLVNLSYSYLAALLFYLLTDRIPFLLNRFQLKPVINNLFKDIQTKYLACGKSPFSLLQYNQIEITKDSVVQQFSQTSFNDHCALYDAGVHLTILEYIQRAHQENTKTIGNILQAYKEYIDVEQLDLLEQLRNPEVGSTLVAFSINSQNLDIPTEREKLAELVYRQIELSRQL